MTIDALGPVSDTRNFSIWKLELNARHSLLSFLVDCDMDFLSLLTLAKALEKSGLEKSGVDFDLEKKTLKIRIGENISITIPFASLIKAKARQSEIQDALSNFFIKKRIFTAPMERETLAACIASLKDIETQIADLKKTSTNPDSYFNQLLTSLSNVAVLSSKDMTQHQEEVLADVQNKHDWQFLPKDLGDLRAKAHPIFLAMTDLLSEKNPIHQQAKEKLKEVETYAIKWYKKYPQDFKEPDYDLIVRG
jgi:hypothetical protein